MNNAVRIARSCATVFILSICAIAPSAAEERASSSPARNILLDVLLEERAVTILFGTDLQGNRRVEGGHEPTITLKTWMDSPRDRSEIVVALHDREGRVLRAFAAPGKPLAFFETSSDEGELRGGPAEPARDERLLRFEVSAKARSLSIYRTQVLRHPADPALQKVFAARFDQFQTRTLGTNRRTGPDDGTEPPLEITFGWTGLGSFPIPGTPPLTDGEPSFPILDQPLSDLDVFDLLRIYPTEMTPAFLRPDPEDFRRVRGEMGIWLREPIGFPECAGLMGSVTGVSALHTADLPASGDTRNFNIVIAGDGFDGSAADSAKFIEFADWAVDVFQTVAPYSTHFANLNIWRVDTRSNASGIANCAGHQTCPNPRESSDTFYQVSGCAPFAAPTPCTPTTWPGYVAPLSMCPIETVLRQQFPLVSVDLVLLVANCSKLGGAAYPDLGLAVLCTREESRFGAETSFRRLVAHECGHVVGRVVDEYWGCAKWEGRTFPNFATAEQVETNTMPWRDDFPQAALTQHVHNTIRCNGRDHNGLRTGSPFVDESLGPGLAMNTVGSFWGCGFANDAALEDSSCCHWYADSTLVDLYTHPGGSDYFRPSPQCRMRRDSYASFCPVCEKAIGDALANPPASIW